MLDSFLDVAQAAGAPGIERFRLYPDKAHWRLRDLARFTATATGWLIAKGVVQDSRYSVTFHLCPGGQVLGIAHHSSYVSTGRQRGHYDPDQRAKIHPSNAIEPWIIERGTGSARYAALSGRQGEGCWPEKRQGIWMNPSQGAYEDPRGQRHHGSFGGESSLLVVIPRWLEEHAARHRLPWALPPDWHREQA